jgi:hypothetical protein
MPSGVQGVSPRCVSMVRRLFMMSGLVMFSRLGVVVGSVCMMFCGFLVVFCSFLWHGLFSLECPWANEPFRLQFCDDIPPQLIRGFDLDQFLDPKFCISPFPVTLRPRHREGQHLVYFAEEPGRRSAAKPLSKDWARRIAANITKLPGLTRQALSGQVPTSASTKNP